MAATPTHPKREPRFTGWHMALIMVAFFGVIIAVNITMAVFANQSWTGLVVKNSYVASQHYNEKLADARVQRARGLHSTLDYRDGVITFTLKDRNGEPVLLENATLLAGRPTYEADDQTLPLKRILGGTYQVEVKLAGGIWKLEIQGHSGNRPYHRQSRLRVDGATGVGQEE